MDYSLLGNNVLKDHSWPDAILTRFHPFLYITYFGPAVILERNVRDQRMLWAALWQGFRVPPFAADDIIKQARRYKSRRDLTRAIRLVAKADLALRSNPVSKRMVLERLVMDLTTEPKIETPGWMQDQLPV